MVITDERLYEAIADVTIEILSTRKNTSSARRAICDRMKTHPLVQDIYDVTPWPSMAGDPIKLKVKFDGTYKTVTIELNEEE